VAKAFVLLKGQINGSQIIGRIQFEQKVILNYKVQFYQDQILELFLDLKGNKWRSSNYRKYNRSACNYNKNETRFTCARVYIDG